MIKISVFIIGIIFFVLNISFTQSIQKETHTFSLGEEKVWVHIYDKPGAQVTFINLHDNESTSAEAGLAFINKYGGHLIELQHGRGREVVVRLNGELNRFDPNRNALILEDAQPLGRLLLRRPGGAGADR